MMPRWSLALLFSGFAAVQAGAHAQSPEVTEAVNARLLVGTFGRICAAPDATPEAIEARATDRGWEQVATGALGDPGIAAMADTAWRDSFGGGDGRNVSFMLFMQAGGDDKQVLTHCGVRYQDISLDGIVAALEASALFEKPEFGGEDDAYCVATYPVAGTAHEIRVTAIAEGIKDGHLTITRSADPNARKRCPITIISPDPDQPDGTR